MSLTNSAENVISMSIYSLLKGEHAEVKALFTALQAAPDVMDDSKQALFFKVRKELLSHAKAEQETVYDKALARVSTATIEESRREHAEVEQQLHALSAMDVTSQEWKDGLKKLIEAVEHHVEEEEEVLFKKMQSSFSDDEATQMAKDFHEAKNRELEKME